MRRSPVAWINDAAEFLTEVRAEFRKVTWPSQREAVAGTIGVVVIVSVITLSLFLVDSVLGWFLKFFLP